MGMAKASRSLGHDHFLLGVAPTTYGISQSWLGFFLLWRDLEFFLLTWFLPRLFPFGLLPPEPWDRVEILADRKHFSLRVISQSELSTTALPPQTSNFGLSWYSKRMSQIAKDGICDPTEFLSLHNICSRTSYAFLAPWHSSGCRAAVCTTAEWRIT